MNKDFLSSTQQISLNENGYIATPYPSIAKIDFSNFANQSSLHSVNWLITRGVNYPDEFHQVIKQNQLDSFLNILLNQEKQTNKVVELDNLLLIAVKNIHLAGQEIVTEQLFFIVSEHFIWSIQAAENPDLSPLINKLNNHQKHYKNTQISHLLFFLMSAILDNYETVYEQLGGNNLFDCPNGTSNSTSIHLIEDKKRELFTLKYALMGLRNVMTGVLKIQHTMIKNKHFSELLVQANHLISDMDFDLQELDSQFNLALSLQSNQLNEIMKVLTIISIIFLPLSLITGIYGMNFVNMPELKWHYGYFIILGVMMSIAISITLYLKHKRWF